MHTLFHESFNFRCIIFLQEMRNYNKHKEPQHKLEKFHTANIISSLWTTENCRCRPNPSHLNLKDAFLHTNSKWSYMEPPVQMIILKLCTQCANRGKEGKLSINSKKLPERLKMAHVSCSPLVDSEKEP